MPTLVATLFPDTTRVSINLDWSDATPDPATALIERVNEDGTVVPVRGADPATLVAGAWVGDDYEAPLDATFYYQATSTDIPGVVVTSANYELSSGGNTWLKHPGRPFFNMIVNVASPPELARPISQGVFDVLGRSRPVAVSMRRSSERGTLQLVTDNDAQRAALWAMLDDGSALYLSTPDGYGIGNIYIACGDVAEQRATKLGKEPTRYWTIPFTVVDRPSGGALAVGNSWSDVLGAYASWSQLLETEGTWTGVLEGID